MPQKDPLPEIIQGGMGVAISDWRLARAVALKGHLGVVSGTGIATVMARRLQEGDVGGHIRRALGYFPKRDLAEPFLERYFIPGGKPAYQPYRLGPMPGVPMPRRCEEELVVANFVEVFLAKEGHNGLVGINLLDKIQLPNPASLLGAMLAGVDVVLMGAGIPMTIPGLLKDLSEGKKVSLPLEVKGTLAEPAHLEFDPATYLAGKKLPGKPRFLAIVSSEVVAKTLLRRCKGVVDGFVVEHHGAGGHNAPPRGKQGENPGYGARDTVNLEVMRALQKPFWLAGGTARADSLEQAKDQGAAGVQAGSIFALCAESGMDSGLRREVVAAHLSGDLQVETDFVASPTGYPFKVARWNGSVSLGCEGERERRACDLGYLRQTYVRPDGRLGFRCPGEPEEHYLKKGGDIALMEGKQCLCNGLLATAGFPQQVKGGAEAPLITLGERLEFLSQLASEEKPDYSVEQALNYLAGTG